MHIIMESKPIKYAMKTVRNMHIAMNLGLLKYALKLLKYAYNYEVKTN